MSQAPLTLRIMEKRGSSLISSIPALHVGRAAPFGTLTVFPLWTDAPAPTGLSFGLSEEVDISETCTVEQLTVVNRTSMPLFLLEGELLEGGWQHRVVVHDFVLAADTRPAQVEVKCVEAHRWHGGESHTRTGRRASPSIRAALTGAAPEPTQAEVWNRVDHYGPVYGAFPTASYLDYLDHLDRQADSVAPDLYRPLPGQRGVLVGAGGTRSSPRSSPPPRSSRLRSTLYSDRCTSTSAHSLRQPNPCRGGGRDAWPAVSMRCRSPQPRTAMPASPMPTPVSRPS